MGVEPTRPYGQRILSLLRGYSPHSTARYQAVFTNAIRPYNFKLTLSQALFVRLDMERNPTISRLKFDMEERWLNDLECRHGTSNYF